MIGALLTGGESNRFGADKALVIGGSVRDALRGAGLDPVVCVGGTAGADLGLVTVPDRRPGAGPLAGLASLLLWAGPDPALVVPCDLPLLSARHLEPLLSAATDQFTHDGDEARAFVAQVNGVVHHSIAVWPAGRGRLLWQAVLDGQRALRHALDLVAWDGVDIDPDAVRDADTPEQLDALSPKLSSRGRTDNQ